MALPIAHSMIGLALGIWRFTPRCASLKEALRLVWQRRAEMFICIIISLAPDIDILFGLSAGRLNLYHHLVTHTLGWTLLTAFCVWLYSKFALKKQPLLAFWFVFLLIAAHLVIDIFTTDTRKPIGIMLAWPFSAEYWHSSVSIFPAPAKKTFLDIFSLHNLKNAGWEFLISLPFVAAALLSKVWKWPGSKRVNIGGEK
ncbi:MAG: metal-dependent hydrolase [Kiritimatiellia bacterium]|nr:metal-dependent hydrolase [Kiritimatiellia bacterium]